MKGFAILPLAVILAISIAAQSGSDTKQVQLTLEKYDQIKIGMTYQRVEQILGAPGKLLGSSVSRGLTGEYGNYEWSTNQAEVFVQFENGRVKDKQEFGLSGPLLEPIRRATVAVLSLEKYNALKMGLNYAETVRIIGAEGTEQTGLSSGRNKSYSWTASDMSSVGATFLNGRLTLKSQFGLGKWPAAELESLPILSLDQFERITLGIGYGDVERILGNGRLSSSTEDAKMRIETFDWRDIKGGSITVVLSQGRVTSKARSKVYAPDSDESAVSAGTVTLAKFRELKLQMTRYQATAVFGTPGVSTDFTQSKGLTVETVVWRSKAGGKVTAIFMNGKLSSADQARLQ